jgi:hypothetical protein
MRTQFHVADFSFLPLQDLVGLAKKKKPQIAERVVTIIIYVEEEVGFGQLECGSPWSMQIPI